MVDVTNKNFDHLLPSVLSDIKSSSFIAVDTEFTGLLVDSVFKNSLFDDGPRRYQKLCSNFRRVTVCQIGLAIYKGVPHSNAYTVTSYNFYLRPCSSVSYDPTFICQTSSLEFLQKYNFDFNKWLYGGVHFMNSDYAEDLQRELISIVKGDKIIDFSFELRDRLSDVGSWVATAEEGDTMTVNLKDDHTNRFLLRVMVHHRFHDLWSDDNDGEVIVKKVSADERTRLQGQDPEGEVLVKDHVDKMLGFTVVFRHLAQLQKPLIFHNGLLDLMLIYKEFHRNLPHTYEKFKANVHEMFPLVYDTKFLATKMKAEFKDKEEPASNLLGNTSLADLVSSLKKEKGVLHFPTISHLPTDKYSREELLHEAGYDAYLTGFCFLSLSHLYAMLKLPSRNHHRPMSPREHVYALKNFANGIMVPRASMQYVNLSGSDPRSKRPPWLVVEGRNNARVSPGMVYTALAQYGALDVVPRNRKSVLVAASSWECTRDILKNLGGDGPLKAVKYSRLKHSPFTRTLAWSGALFSTGLSAWLIYSTLKKSS